MNLSDFLNTLVNSLTNLLADKPGLLRRDLENNVRAILEAGFAKLDLVTREEFDVQVKVLARCREKIAELEQIVQQQEQE